MRTRHFLDVATIKVTSANRGLKLKDYLARAKRHSPLTLASSNIAFCEKLIALSGISSLLLEDYTGTIGVKDQPLSLTLFYFL